MPVIAAWIVAGLLVAALLYSVFGMYAAWRFFRVAPRPRTAAAVLPPVSVLKPLKGAPPDLYENLASFCRLDYPVFQLVCGVRDAGDPAVGVVHRLQRDFANCDIRLVIDPRVIGSNYKVSTLHHLMNEVEYDYLVVTDSDVSVQPDYLRTIIPPLTAAGVGVVSCVYRGEAPQPLPALLESLMINTTFIPQVVVAGQIEAPRYAFGATMAVTRDCLEAIGGFAALRDYLADDYYLGLHASRAGYEVEVLPVVVKTRPDACSFDDLFHHQLRWARTQRNCRPAGYVGTVVTYGTFWAAVGLLGWWSSPELRLLALVTLGGRLGSAALLERVFLRSRLPPASLLLIPFTDLLSFAIWCISLGGNTVHWREHRFRVQQDGRMVRINNTRDDGRPDRPTLDS